MKRLKIILSGLVFSILLGCETLPQRDPDFAPTQATDLHPPQQANGAIYQSGYDMRLFEDQTAKRVGDILIITLDENTNAQKSADLGTSKDNLTSVTAPNFAGVDPSLLFGNDLSATLASNHQFKGSGQANQSNRLRGRISVSVVAVLPNGYLKIRGEKRITLNDGNEFIRIAGIVRPVDIDASNIISSSQIADATIMYTGDGALANSSKLGWLSKIFQSPIFPF